MMRFSKEQMADLAARKQAQDGAARKAQTESSGPDQGPKAEAKSGKAEKPSPSKKDKGKDPPPQPPAPPKQPVPPPSVIEPCPQRKKQVLLYLLFYVTKNDHGDTFFAEAAQTRLQNIKASLGYDDAIHKVHCPPIQDLGEVAVIVARYIAKYGGSTVAFCKEVGVFSHAGLDGPIGSQVSSVAPSTPAEYCQMELSAFPWSHVRPTV